MKHPCVNKCNSHLTTDGICTGCYRSVDEIREYNGMSDQQKMAVLALCEARRQSKEGKGNG